MYTLDTLMYPFKVDKHMQTYENLLKWVACQQTDTDPADDVQCVRC